MSQLRTDQELLRRFEPILRFTRGEQFFPLNAEAYVRSCSLWVQRPEEEPRQLLAAGQLNLDTLAYPYPDEFGTVHFLKLTDPLGVTEMAAYNLRKHRTGEGEQRFHVGRGRLARVGYGARLIDALFSISLLARGRVPGDTAAAALLAYQRIVSNDERPVYHGRVVRENGWIVLQYWFFYLFNNWRSGFFGANDHEADWEMICIYLTEEEVTGEVQPEWVAYATHDQAGDDLRRRWDDPEVTKLGEHPVVYVGAGSHASYFQPGEYLTEMELPFLAPFVRITDWVQKFLQEHLRQYEGENPAGQTDERTNIFRIPFVDYARGDGLAIGPGQALTWSEPHWLTPTPRWVSLYRGLWGLYTRDPFAGEDAPAGPMFNRNGSVRRAWYDPVGWAGLDKVVPSDVALAQIAAEQETLRDAQLQLRVSVDEKARTLQGLGARVAAMRLQPHLYQLYTAHQEQVDALSNEVNQLRSQMATNQALLEALEFYAEQLRAGARGPARAHIRRAHHPTTHEQLRITRIAEIWAAVSVGLMMVILVLLVDFARHYLVFGLTAMITLFAILEAGFRGQMIRLVTGITLGLSSLAALVILYEYFWPIVLGGVLLAGSYIVWENLRELWW